MGKCRYDLSEDCNKRDCLDCVLDKIRAEINTPNRGTCDYFIVDKIEEIVHKYKVERISEDLSCDDMAENGLCRFCDDKDQCASDIEELSMEIVGGGEQA